MNDKETIREAFFALAGSRSPALTKKQQDKELARCWKLLSEAVYPAVSVAPLKEEPRR